MEEKLKKHVIVPISCSPGDFGTIYYFQITDHTHNTVQIMSLAMGNGQWGIDIHPSRNPNSC